MVTAEPITKTVTFQLRDFDEASLRLYFGEEYVPQEPTEGVHLVTHQEWVELLVLGRIPERLREVIDELHR